MNLEQAKYVSLRTFRKSGAAVDTPVWIASESDTKHYVFSARNAGKVKRLRNSPESQVATCDYRGGSLGGWLDCRAFLVDDEAEVASAHQLFIGKYGMTMRITDFFSRLSGRLDERDWIRIEL